MANPKAPIPLPSVERLQALFRLDEATGHLYWRVARNSNAAAGQVAGTDMGKGYLSVSINNRMYRVHRVIWKIAYGSDPIGQLDHINGDRGDNRPENLREATNAQNQVNAKRRSRSGAARSQYRGVLFYKKAWQANIVVDRKKRYLGTFPTELEAAQVYERAAIELHGEFYKPQGIV